MARLLKFIIALIVLLALVTWAPLQSRGSAAVVMQRDDGGQWVRQGPTEWGLPLAIEHSADTHSSGTRTFRSVPEPAIGGGPFHATRIWILSLGSERASREIGRAIQEALVELPGLDEVSYFPSGDLPLDVRRPPHLFVTVDVPMLHERHLPWLLEQRAFVHMTVARRPLGSRWSDSQEMPGPCLEARMEYGGDVDGLVSQASRYSDMIAKALDMLDLPGDLAAWSEARGKGRGLPLAWAGIPGAPPADLPLLDDPQAQLISAVAPPPLLQEHTWQIPAGQDPLARIEAAEDQLSSAGWTMESSQRTIDGRLYFLCASLGSRLVEVFETVHYADSGKLGDGRSLTVFHQLRPELSELLEWLREHGEPAEQRDAAVELIQSLHANTRKSLRALLEAGSDAATTSWIDQALARAR